MLVSFVPTALRSKGRKVRKNSSRKSRLTVREVASLLRVHPKTVRRWSDQELLKTSRVGPRHDRTFELEDVNSFLSQLRTIEDSRKGTVLIVDNDLKTRRMLKHVIEGQGYNAIAAENVERALAELEKHQFDMIFLDLVLPGSSGVDVLRAIKAKDRITKAAVVIAYGDDSVAAEAVSVRPFVFIRKPFAVTDIIKVLHTLEPKR
jgi:excisionase family DNA binding protein